MPEPAEGETLNSWSARATQWRSDARKTPGPKKSPERQRREDLETAILEEKLAKIRRENKVEAGELHSRKDCESEQGRNCHVIATAFLSLGARVARKCYQASSPDAIQGLICEEARRILEILSGSGANQTDVSGLADDGGDDPQAGDPPRADAS